MRLAEKAFGKQLDQFRVYDCLKNFIEKFFSFNLVNLNENDTPKFIEPSLINFTIPKEADFKLWIDELESLKPEGYEKADLTPLKLPETTAKTEQESDKERVARVAQLKQMEERAHKEIEREREEEKRRGSKIQSISNNAPVVNTSVIERELPKTPEEFAQQMERLQKLAMEQIEREREEERKEKDSN